MREFHKPTFINPNIEISEERLPGSSVVKLAKRELPKQSLKPGEEIKTEHFYIKQVGNAVAEETGEFPLGLPEYWQADYIGHVHYAIGSLEKEGKIPSADELTKHFERSKDKLELEQGETVRSKIEKALYMLNPETVLKYHKNLYERHRKWYNGKIPGFVIDKLFVLGKDEDGKQRGYILKEHVTATQETDGYPGLSFIDILDSVRKVRVSEEETKEISSDFIRQAQRVFSPEQRATLKGDLRKFIPITRNIIQKEGLVVDPGGAMDDRAPNIWIAADGHLHMIDTDRVFRAKTGDGRFDTPAQQVLAMLKILKYVGDHLDDSL